MCDHTVRISQPKPGEPPERAMGRVDVNERDFIEVREKALQYGKMIEMFFAPCTDDEEHKENILQISCAKCGKVLVATKYHTI